MASVGSTGDAGGVGPASRPAINPDGGGGDRARHRESGGGPGACQAGETPGTTGAGDGIPPGMGGKGGGGEPDDPDGPLDGLESLRLRALAAIAPYWAAVAGTDAIDDATWGSAAPAVDAAIRRRQRASAELVAAGRAYAGARDRASGERSGWPGMAGGDGRLYLFGGGEGATAEADGLVVVELTRWLAREIGGTGRARG